MTQETTGIFITSFYQFFSCPKLAGLQSELSELCSAHGLKGTILLAEEGINATVSGSKMGILALKTFLQGVGAKEFEYKDSKAQTQPFHRMKIKLKKEIIHLGITGLDPANKTGELIAPDLWNDILDQPGLCLLDIRNDYETELGTFRDATLPSINIFIDFPNYVEKELSPATTPSVAMFCTGGIRCEKASAFLLEQGFKKVYQLHGGILNYLDKIPAEESRWQGECFVFDNRVSVNTALEQGSYQQCFACRRGVSWKDRQSPLYEVGVSCPACYPKKTIEQKQSYKERQKQVSLATQRGEQHIGKAMPHDG